MDDVPGGMAPFAAGVRRPASPAHGVNPAIEQLRRLCRVGFHGERLFNQHGDLNLIHYTREFRGLREVVLVYSERRALAYRTRDMLDPDSPLHITQNATEWRLHSDVVSVVNALLSLPATGDGVGS